jgi:hypothetical protein
MRQVERQVAADLDQTPPFGKRGLIIDDVFEQVRAIDRVRGAVGKERHPLAGVDSDIGVDFDAKQLGVDLVVDADCGRVNLARPATEIEHSSAHVGNEIKADLAAFVALRRFFGPCHCRIPNPPEKRVMATRRESALSGRP